MTRPGTRLVRAIGAMASTVSAAFRWAAGGQCDLGRVEVQLGGVPRCQDCLQVFTLMDAFPPDDELLSCRRCDYTSLCWSCKTTRHEHETIQRVPETIRGNRETEG